MDIYRMLSSKEANNWDIFVKCVKLSNKHKKIYKAIVNRKSRGKLKAIDRRDIDGLYEKENR